MSIDDLQSQGLGFRSMSRAGLEGADNGGVDALEGSFIEGSGKALIRNGRIQLLEWKPFADTHVQYNTFFPPRPQSVGSNLSDSPYRTAAARMGARVKGSVYAAHPRPASSTSYQRTVLAMKKPNARLSAERGGEREWMDHVKMRQAADEWLSAQTNIRRKLQGLLPVPHSVKSSSTPATRLHLNLAPTSSLHKASHFHKAVGDDLLLPGSSRKDEKDVRARRLRLRNIWKGDLQARDAFGAAGACGLTN